MASKAGFHTQDADGEVKQAFIHEMLMESPLNPPTGINGTEILFFFTCS